jgi:hypothetical protein
VARSIPTIRPSSRIQNPAGITNAIKNQARTIQVAIPKISMAISPVSTSGPIRDLEKAGRTNFTSVLGRGYRLGPPSYGLIEAIEAGCMWELSELTGALLATAMLPDGDG